MAVSGEGNHGLSKLIEDGILPQAIAGSAGKAICRLIGAAADIPAAWLEGISQGIRDKTDARSLVSKAMAQQVAARAAENPAMMDRAMTNMVARAYRVQENKEAVARIAVEDLKSDPPPPESEGPSDGWMSKFEHYAEDATDDDIRIMFGKLLAGEIRKPGTISKMTLHLVSILDAETTKLISRTLSFCIDGNAIIIECINPRLSVIENSYLNQYGFWDDSIQYNSNLDSSGKSIREYGTDGKFGFCVTGEPNKKVMFEAAVLSRAGRDLISIVGKPFNLQSFANTALSKVGVAKFFYGRVVKKGNTITIISPIELHKTA